MKTTFTAALIAIHAVTSFGADNAQRIGMQRGGTNPEAMAAVNESLAYSKALLVDPIRIVDGKEHDLRPLFQWVRHGHQVNGKYLIPRPTKNWMAVSGTITKVVDNGVMIENFRGGRLHLLNPPKGIKMEEGNIIDLIACEVGSFQYKTPLGTEKTIASFSYGVPVSAERIKEIADQEDAKRADLAAQRDAEAKAKAEAHERNVEASKAKLEELRKRNGQ